MKCAVVQQLLSSYLDGAVTRSQWAQINDHMEGCANCSAEYEALRQTQKLVGSLGRTPAPPEVALRVRVAISQELANVRRPRWESMLVRWQNAFNAVMVPATAGLVTTIIIFGLLISFLYPGQLSAANDVPTAFYTPPELQFAPFELGRCGGVAAAPWAPSVHQAPSCNLCSLLAAGVRGGDVSRRLLRSGSRAGPISPPT